MLTTEVVVCEQNFLFRSSSFFLKLEFAKDFVLRKEVFFELRNIGFLRLVNADFIGVIWHHMPASRPRP